MKKSNAPASDARPSFMKRTVTRKTGAIVAGSTLVVGVLLGVGMGGAGTQSQLTSLKSEVVSLQSDVSAAKTTVDDSGTKVTAANKERDTAKSDRDAATKDRDAAKARVTELEAAAAASQKELDSRAAQIADLQSKVPAQTAPVQSTSPNQSSTQSKSSSSDVYYKNCAAARAAGAAPVRRGDPGYGKHLDRDGDGIGCE